MGGVNINHSMVNKKEVSNKPSKSHCDGASYTMDAKSFNYNLREFEAIRCVNYIETFTEKSDEAYNLDYGSRIVFIFNHIPPECIVEILKCNVRIAHVVQNCCTENTKVSFYMVLTSK